MASDKGLAAEIEAVLLERLTACTSNGVPIISGIPEAAAEIAVQQKLAFEEGARWMREKAIEECEGQRNLDHGEWGAGYDSACERCAEKIEGLPLHPEGEQPTPTTEDKGREDRA
ncbi:hypothetical protein ABEV34_24890 [Methylorubrum rhodesianum]|uniref:hypothetical protein n=1 Tax=Methylorubrum rhodesianum TaxID=29427 RepID=UPI003D2DF8FE